MNDQDQLYGLFIEAQDNRKAMQEVIRLLYEIRDHTREHMLPPGTAQMLMIGSVSMHQAYLTSASHFAEFRLEAQSTGIRISLIVDGGQILWQTLVHFHPDDIVAMNSKASRI